LGRLEIVKLHVTEFSSASHVPHRYEAARKIIIHNFVVNVILIVVSSNQIFVFIYSLFRMKSPFKVSLEINRLGHGILKKSYMEEV
jgi:tmRNA-binding protein